MCAGQDRFLNLDWSRKYKEGLAILKTGLVSMDRFRYDSVELDRYTDEVETYSKADDEMKRYLIVFSYMTWSGGVIF